MKYKYIGDEDRLYNYGFEVNNLNNYALKELHGDFGIRDIYIYLDNGEIDFNVFGYKGQDLTSYIQHLIDDNLVEVIKDEN